MGYHLFPMLVFAIWAGIFAIENTQTEKSLPKASYMQASGDGQQFIVYRNAVATYLQANPAFIGSVPSSTLISQGNRFSSTFIASTGNYISQVGSSTGRVITCYSSLAPGAITAALKQTSNDASLGIASGTNWTSYAQGVINTPQPLATTVPNGNVVSVIQIGG